MFELAEILSSTPLPHPLPPPPASWKKIKNSKKIKKCIWTFIPPKICNSYLFCYFLSGKLSYHIQKIVPLYVLVCFKIWSEQNLEYSWMVMHSFSSKFTIQELSLTSSVQNFWLIHYRLFSEQSRNGRISACKKIGKRNHFSMWVCKIYIMSYLNILF